MGDKQWAMNNKISNLKILYKSCPSPFGEGLG
jgi:hypothetical protein